MPGFNALTVGVITGALLMGSLGSAHAANRPSPSSERGVSPLHVSASGRYFESAGKRPWFWLGDTAWSLLTAYTPAEENQYLAARAAMGFSLIQVVAAWDGGTGSEVGLKPNPDTAGVQPWRNNDPLQPNEAYWKNVDTVVAAAARDGLYVGLLPAWGSFVVNYKTITLANAEAYGRWVGHRYRNSPNIVWIVDGDRAVSDAPEVWRAMAHGLQEGDGGAHLITLHPKGEGLKPDGLLHGEPWLAADMIQTWAFYTDIPAAIAVDYARTPAKPVILGEGAYEAGPEYPTRPITPLIIRKQAYWTYLSGAFFTYGHSDMWRKASTWRGSLASEGAKDMRVLRSLFDSLPWWELQPDQAFFASGQGTGETYNASAVAADKSWAMVYFSSPSHAELRLGTLKASKFLATWIDPRTGHRVNEKPFPGAGDQSFSTPQGWPDALLLLQRQP